MVVMTNEEKKSAYEIMIAQAEALFANEERSGQLRQCFGSLEYHFAQLSIYRLLSDG